MFALTQTDVNTQETIVVAQTSSAEERGGRKRASRSGNAALTDGAERGHFPCVRESTVPAPVGSRYRGAAPGPSMEGMVVVISAPRRRRSPPWFGAETRRALAAGLAVAALALAAGWPYWRDHAAAAALSVVSTG